MNGQETEEVDKFKYFRVMISADGGMCEEVADKLMEGRKLWGTMRKL